MYRLQHHAYCGMSDVPQVFTDRADARQAAADLIRDRRRSGISVRILARGAKWEALEPVDCAMVPDDCGTISLTRQTWECRECGFDHDTAEDARECCAIEWPEDFSDDPDGCADCERSNGPHGECECEL